MYTFYNYGKDGWYFDIEIGSFFALWITSNWAAGIQIFGLSIELEVRK